MPNVSAALFIAKVLNRDTVQEKRVLDVGSFDYNGSVSGLIKNWMPSEYIGVDVTQGPGVDIVCLAEDLVTKFGKDSFDIVICVEMLEHAKSWQKAIGNIKEVLKDGGILALTTRSIGYPCHGFPHDFWRFEKEDMQKIFADFEIFNIEKDSIEPGIFIFAKKNKVNKEVELEEIAVYSVVLNKHIKKLPDNYQSDSFYKKLKLKQNIKKIASESFIITGKYVSRFLGIR